MKLKYLIPAAVMLLTSGCGSEPVTYTQTEQVQISMSWWGNDKRNEYTIEAIKKFEQLHPDIKVTCSYSEWSGYQSRYNAQIFSNTESDVMQINYNWLIQYSPDGSGYYDISQLSDYIDLNNFSEDELSYGIMNGKLNAVPIALNTQTMYINKTVYDKFGLPVPKTWDDMFAAARTMNGEAYPLSMTSKSSWFFIVAYAEQQVGKPFMTMDGKLNFTASDIKIMLEFYKKLIDEKVIPQVEYFDKLEIESGKYAGSVSWLSDASSYCGKAVEKGNNIIVADYPHTVSASVGDGWYAKPATMYAVSRNTDHPKEAAILLDYLLNSPEMADLQGTEKGIPLSKAAREHLESHDKLEGIQYKAFEKMNEYTDSLAVISPYFENATLIDEFRDACNKVYFDKSSADEVAGELVIKFNSILTEARGS